MVNKYKAAAEIANGESLSRCGVCTVLGSAQRSMTSLLLSSAGALAAVLSALKSGAKKVDLAILGDKFIEE